MGEKGMESPAPSRSGVAGAADAVARMPGVTNMGAALGGGSLVGGMQQGAGAGLGEALTEPIQQANDAIRRPPEG